LPVSVGLRAWTPFLPGDSAGSNVPGAVFEIHLRNPSKVRQKGTVVLSFPGPIEAEAGPGTYDRHDVRGPVNGVCVEKVWTPPKSWAGQPFTFSYVLGVAGEESFRTGGGLARDGAAWQAVNERLPEPDAKNSSSSLAIDFALPAGESTTIRCVLAWYAPWMRVQQWDGSIRFQDGSVRHYRHKYAGGFNSSQEIATFLAENHESILNRILAWQQVVFSDEQLPVWLRESLVNVLHILPRCSFWETSVPRGSNAKHWFGPEGMFCMNESLVSCPQQNCIPCDWIGNHPIVMFFPDLAASTLRGLSHFQRFDGEVPFILGHGTDMESPTHGNQAPIDGSEYVQLVDRLWQTTGDDAILSEFYPNAKAALKFVRAEDSDGDGVPNCEGVNHLYDAWNNYGNSIHTSGLYMASLKIADRMARQMGDAEFAQECAQLLATSSESVESNLWDELTNSYNVYYEPATGKRSNSILADQLAGEWVAQYHDVSGVFRPERVETVMRTLCRLNYAATPYGLMNCVQPDAKSDASSIYTRNAITPSYSNMCPAMTMCYLNKENLKEIGLEIMRRNWENMVCRQDFAWNMPACLDADGDVRYGEDYYHNTMLWAVPAAIRGDSLREFCANGGLVDRIKTAASKQNGPLTSQARIGVGWTTTDGKRR
jgi:non-lysosomal glucosylceramidase